jgi:hypothetical protein
MKDMIDICRFVCGVLGKEGSGSVFEGDECIAVGQVIRNFEKQKVYCDEKVIIFSSLTTLALEVVIRSGVTKSGNSNPAIMVVENGETIRCHGEISYIDNHIRNLLDQAVNSCYSSF